MNGEFIIPTDEWESLSPVKVNVELSLAQMNAESSLAQMNGEFITCTDEREVMV